MRGLMIASCMLVSLLVVSHAETFQRTKEIQVLVANAGCKGAGEPFPNPEDCGSFLQCEAPGLAALQKCPAGLHFNAELKVCDYPWVADCSQEDSASSDSSSSEEGDGADSSAEGSSSEEGDGADSSSEESEEEDKKATPAEETETY